MSTFTKDLTFGLVVGISSTALVAATCPSWAPLAIAAIWFVSAISLFAIGPAALPSSRRQALGQFEDWITGQPIKRRKHIACLMRTRELEAWHAKWDDEHDDRGREYTTKTDRQGTRRKYDADGNCIGIMNPGGPNAERSLNPRWDDFPDKTPWYIHQGIGETGATGPTYPRYPISGTVPAPTILVDGTVDLLPPSGMILESLGHKGASIAYLPSGHDAGCTCQWCERNRDLEAIQNGFG